MELRNPSRDEVGGGIEVVFFFLMMVYFTLFYFTF